MRTDGRTHGQTDGRTDGRIDMTKLIVICRNFANAPKNSNMDHSLTNAFSNRSCGREKKWLLVNTVSAT